jgi:hypothetical protein
MNGDIDKQSTPLMEEKVHKGCAYLLVVQTVLLPLIS